MEHDKNWLPIVIDSALGAIPYAGTAVQNAFAVWRNKNISVAREVLLSNIRAGDISAVHEDELFSMLARFSRSVQEGMAKSNLTLLARLITGIGHADKENAKAETFNQYADMLENLTWLEIVFLSRCIKAGEVISGTPEIKQILQQKGFFVYNLDPLTNEHGTVVFKHLHNALESMDEDANFNPMVINAKGTVDLSELYYVPNYDFVISSYDKYAERYYPEYQNIKLDESKIIYKDNQYFELKSKDDETLVLKRK